MNRHTQVLIVDDEESQRSSLLDFFSSVGIQAKAFADAQTFLASYIPNGPACLVADMMMGGMSGLALQKTVRDKHPELPVILITAYGDIECAVQAMKDGAFDFIEKPIRNQKLLECVHEAIASSRASFASRHTHAEAEKRLSALTKRERDVFDLIAQGYTSKMAAAEIGIARKTVEIHRANIIKKTGLKSVPEMMELRETTQGVMPAKENWREADKDAAARQRM